MYTNWHRFSTCILFAVILFIGQLGVKPCYVVTKIALQKDFGICVSNQSINQSISHLLNFKLIN